DRYPAAAPRSFACIGAERPARSLSGTARHPPARQGGGQRRPLGTARMRTAGAASGSNDSRQKMSNEHAGPTGYSWAYDTRAIDWEELSGLYRIARSATSHRTRSRPCSATACSRAPPMPAVPWPVLADGLDCAYIADVAAHPA